MYTIEEIMSQLWNPHTIVMNKGRDGVNVTIKYILKKLDTNSCKKLIDNWEITTTYYKWMERVKIVKFRILSDITLFPQVFQLLQDRSRIGSKVKFLDSC